jgi:Rrf2 family protein
MDALNFFAMRRTRIPSSRGVIFAMTLARLPAPGARFGKLAELVAAHLCTARSRADGMIRSMRMSAKAEYAVRAMVQLATVDEGTLVKTDDLATAQGIPPQFLVDILSALRTDRLVRSHRGRDGGYALARPAAEISIADVLRCIDGPLASVRDIGLGDLPYSGPTASLTDVWRALRASMRSVLEQTTLADVASGELPDHVAELAGDYRGQEEQRGHG